LSNFEEEQPVGERIVSESGLEVWYHNHYIL
jgi:hypothetical protein